MAYISEFYKLKSLKDLLKEEHKLVKEYNEALEILDSSYEFDGREDAEKDLEKVNKLRSEITTIRTNIKHATNIFEPIQYDRLINLNPYGRGNERNETYKPQRPNIPNQPRRDSDDE